MTTVRDRQRRRGSSASGADMRRAVEQILHARPGERFWIPRGLELRGNSPCRIWPVNRHAHGAAFQAARIHEGALRLNVRLCLIKAGVGAVGLVTEQGVGHGHPAVVTGNIPSIRIRSGQAKCAPVRIHRANRVHVLRILGECVPTCGTPGHPHVENPRRHSGEHGLHLSFVVDNVREGNLINDFSTLVPMCNGAELCRRRSERRHADHQAESHHPGFKG